MKNITSLLCNLLLCYIIIASTSCSLLRKQKTVYKSSIDSTSQVVEKKDSSVIKDIVAVSKDSSKTSDEIVIEFWEEPTGGQSVIGNGTTLEGIITDSGIIYTTKPDDYFTITREGITTNKPIKSVRIKSSQNVFNYDSLADHSKIRESELKQSDTHVNKSQKEVTIDKRAKRFPVIQVTIAALIVGIVVYIFLWVRRKKKQVEKITDIITKDNEPS